MKIIKTIAGMSAMMLLCSCAEVPANVSDEISILDESRRSS